MLALLEHAVEEKYALAHNTLGKERFQEADEGLALQTMNRCIVREYLRIFSEKFQPSAPRTPPLEDCAAHGRPGQLTANFKPRSR